MEKLLTQRDNSILNESMVSILLKLNESMVSILLNL